MTGEGPMRRSEEWQAVVSLSLVFTKLVFTPVAVIVSINLLLTIATIVKLLHSPLQMKLIF